MAPVGRPVPVSEAEDNFSKGQDDELKEEPPDDRGLHEEVHIKIEEEAEGYEVIYSYPAMNDDEGVVIKTEDSDNSLEEDEKPDVIGVVCNNLEDNHVSEKAANKSNSDKTEDSSNPLLCKVCGKQFFRAYYFNLHIKTHENTVMNNSSSDKPHKCPECGKSFALLQHLAGHSRIHIAGQYYECPVCRRKFTELSNLTMHLLKTHPDEKPYKCSECDKQFTQSSALKKHLRSHSSITSQEELDRIDTLFYVRGESEKEIEEPVKKKIKIEKDDDITSSPKEKAPVSEEKRKKKEEKSPSSKGLSTPLKVKSPSKDDRLRSSKGQSSPMNAKSPPKEDKSPSSKGQAASIKAKSPTKEKPLSSKLKSPHKDKADKPKEKLMLSEDFSVDVKHEFLPVSKESPPEQKISTAIVTNASSDDQFGMTESLLVEVDVHIKEEPIDETDSPSLYFQEEPFTPENVSISSSPSITLKNKSSLVEHKQLPSMKKDYLKEYQKNGVPPDQVQNPHIKGTKFAKGTQESDICAKVALNSTASLRSISGSDENYVESQESSEETENSNHSSLCSGDRGLKGRQVPLASLTRNKSDWTSGWDKNRSESREPLPCLEKPDGEFDEQFRCHRCDIFFDSEDNLYDHLMEHQGVKLCECRFCGKNFSSMISLKRHLYYHVQGSISQDCSRCGKTFFTFKDLKEHCINNDCDTTMVKTYRCFRCRRTTTSLKRLKVHLLSQCNDEPVKYYLPKKSDGSGKENESDSERNAGKDNESVGGATGSEKVAGTNDWVTQKFEKSGISSQSDIQELNLDADDVEAIQLFGEFPAGRERECWSLQCQNCGHRFENREKAALHAKLGCDPNSDKMQPADKENTKIKVVFEENEGTQCTLSCAECDTVVAGVEKMLLHIQEHLQERNVMTCPVLKCGKLFKTPVDFKLHLKAHTGHKPYKCADCGKRFFLRDNYENHAQRHGILKNWSSLNRFVSDKAQKMISSGKSPITIESSITNLEVAEADAEKKVKNLANLRNPANVKKSGSVKNPARVTQPTNGSAAFRNHEMRVENFRAKVASSKTSPAYRTSIVTKRPAPAVKRSSTAAPTPPVKKLSSAADRPSPPVEKTSPELNRSSPAFERSSPVFDRPSPILLDRPSPPVLKSSPSVQRPPTILRPPAVLNRPIPILSKPPVHILPQIISAPAPFLKGPYSMSQSSGGSFSVTSQGIFSVAPQRSYSGPVSSSSRQMFAVAESRPGGSRQMFTVAESRPGLAPKDSNVRINPSSYYRMDENSRASIKASNAELRRYPRSGCCQVCNKICSRLDKHMMVHLNQKPHLCPVCPQSFRQSEHLRRHIRAKHEGNHRQFECPQCHKRLTRKDKLKEHMKNCCRAVASATIQTLGNSLFEMIPGPSDSLLEGHTVM